MRVEGRYDEAIKQIVNEEMRVSVGDKHWGLSMVRASSSGSMYELYPAPMIQRVRSKVGARPRVQTGGVSSHALAHALVVGARRQQRHAMASRWTLQLLQRKN